MTMDYRTDLNVNCIDTPQIIDGCVTVPKLGADVMALVNIMPQLTYATGIGFTAGTSKITDIPAGSVVLGAYAVCTATFDSDTAITIGRATAQTSLLPAPGLTLGNVTGTNPSTDYGSDLWQTGTHTPGSLSAGSQTKTPSAWALTALHVGADSNMDSHTQGSTAGDWTNTQGSFTAGAVTTWACPLTKYCATKTTYNAYITSTAGTVGSLNVYILYIGGVV